MLDIIIMMSIALCVGCLSVVAIYGIVKLAFGIILPMTPIFLIGVVIFAIYVIYNEYKNRRK